MCGGSLEQLFHEVEQKYIDLKSKFALCETEKQEIAQGKHAAGACVTACVWVREFYQMG